MGLRRINFAEEDESRRPEPKVWLTRCLIAGVLVGLGGATHVLLGWSW
jgi:hypothetical protein